MVHKFGSKTPPKVTFVGVPNTRSGRSSLLKDSSKINHTFSWSRARTSSGASGELKDSKRIQRYVTKKPWNMKHNRSDSQDSGRENILPLHTIPSARLETGILKTVDVNVGTGETGSGGTAN